MSKSTSLFQKTFFLVVAAAILVGCESTSESANLSNSELRIEITDDWNGGVHHIEILLKDRSATNRRVELSGDDELVVVVDNQNTSVTEEFGSGLYYGANASSSVGEVTVQLSGSTRTTATVTFDLGEDTTFSAARDIPWSETSNDIEVEFDENNGGTNLVTTLECVGNDNLPVLTEQSNNISSPYTVTLTDLIADYNDDNEPDVQWSDYSSGCTAGLALEQALVSSPIVLGFGSSSVMASQTESFSYTISEGF